MSATATVTIHASQFPEAVRRDLLASLQTRRINHKFLYDSVKQTQLWLALHQAHSPSRNDPDCTAIYDESFAALEKHVRARKIHLIGLGCGGGQKDTRLLKLLRAGGREVFYTPCDVSAAMVLVARQAALSVVPEHNCFPLVCDLGAANDLTAVFRAQQPRGTARIVTFFGMIPNFEPQQILPKLAGLIRRQDRLLFSANLAPGSNYAAGLDRILPQYDNPATRAWLLSFLFDLGVERGDGRLDFRIESGAARTGLKRVVASFQFLRACEIGLDSKRFRFQAGQVVRLFFSYRHTPDLVQRLLGRQKLRVRQQWIAGSQEEGVFLCCK